MKNAPSSADRALRSPVRWFLAGLATILLPCGVSLGDQVHLKDGRVVEGEIISETVDLITVKPAYATGTAAISLKKQDVKSVVRQPIPARKPPASAPAATKPAKPRYFPLPVTGTIGVEVTADLLRQALNEARRKGVKVVVLVFDADGGTVEETGKVIEVIAGAKDMRFIAHVRKAVSAPAVLALTCPDIYMAPRGTIGEILPSPEAPASQPTTTRPDGVDKKLRQAVEDLSQRVIALGLHSELVVRGMIEPDLELSIAAQDGVSVVVEGRGGKLLKEKGRVLTLSAKAAVECGLARGVADDPDAIGAALGYGRWERDPAGWAFMTRKAEENRQTVEKALREQEDRARREELLKRVGPQLAELERRIEQTRASGKAAEATKSELERLYNAETGEVVAQYKQACREADFEFGFDSVMNAALKTRAREIRDIKLLEIRNRYQPQAITIQASINRLLAQLEALAVQRQQLVDSVADKPKNH